MAGKVVKQLAGSGTGQSLTDMFTSVKHSISGSVVAKVICKATTEEMTAPKRKHLQALVALTYNPNLSIIDFSNYLLDRLRNSSWVVIFKSLITIHHLMQYGSDKFSEYLASCSSVIQVKQVPDKSILVQSVGRKARTMSSYIYSYSNYLMIKASSYQKVGFDFCKVKRGKEEGNLRNMSPDKLFKNIPILEMQLDALVDFNVTSNELSNSVLLSAHLLLYKDLIKLYAIYNEGMINLIERFFDMNKKQCQDALVLYRSFVKRMDTLNVFVRVAEEANRTHMLEGFSAESILFKPVPDSVLIALETHLAHLEGKRGVDKNIRAITSSQESDRHQQAITFPSTTVTGGMRNSSTSDDPTTVKDITEEQKRRIIEEERRRLESFVQNARSRTDTQLAIEAKEEVDFKNDFMDLMNEFNASPAPSMENVGQMMKADNSSAPAVQSWDAFFTKSDFTTNAPVTMQDTKSPVQSNQQAPLASAASTSSQNMFFANTPVDKQPAPSIQSVNPFGTVTDIHVNGGSMQHGLMSSQQQQPSNNPFAQPSLPVTSAAALPLTPVSSQQQPNLWAAPPPSLNSTTSRTPQLSATASAHLLNMPPNNSARSKSASEFQPDFGQMSQKMPQPAAEDGAPKALEDIMTHLAGNISWSGQASGVKSVNWNRPQSTSSSQPQPALANSNPWASSVQMNSTMPKVSNMGGIVPSSSTNPFMNSDTSLADNPFRN